ncbi:MAG: sensor histidine kinase [Minisyncoccia bacterium]
MKTFIKILSGTLLYAFALFLVWALVNNQKYVYLYALPTWLLPAISVVTITFVCIFYIKTYRKLTDVENKFTTIVNHTFRTPLTKITWALKELRETEYNQQRLAYLQEAENSSNRILNIVDILAGMQDVYNSSSYFFKKVSIREIIETSISKYKQTIKEKGFKFNIETFTDIPPLTADLKKMSFVFDVVMENALYYTPAGGSIMVGAVTGKNKIIFYVADSGIGLNGHDKRNLFTKFYRGDRARAMYTDGMGLGLYLSKTILKKHGGSIYAKSLGADKGTTFFVELPTKYDNKLVL